MEKSLKRLHIFAVIALVFTFLMGHNAQAIEPSEVQLDKLSFQQLQQAAEAGDPDAQYALGYMYYYGKNAPQNTQEALNWIKRASVQGQEQAIKALALLGGESPQKSEPVTQPSVRTAPAINAEPLAKVVPANTATPTNTMPAPKSSSSVDIPTASAAPPARAITTSGLTNSLASQQQHLLSIPANYHTVQLLGSYSEKEVVNYINANSLQGKVSYYRGDNKGKDWYVVLYGVYKTRSEAQAAISTLPAPLKKKNPWVKSIASVQASIKQKMSPA